MNIPQNCQLIAGEAVQQVTESCGVRVDTGGLNEQGNVFFSCLGQQDGQILPDLIFVVSQSNGADVGNVSVLGHFHQRFQPPDAVGAGRQVVRAVKAGNLQLLFPELTDSSGGPIFMERTGLIQQGIELGQIVNFNATKAHIQSQIHHFLPAQFGPATGGKGEFHASSSS